jgi:PPOX class probable FMN-dependent enzyme
MTIAPPAPATATGYHTVTSLAALRELLGEPSERAVRKQLAALDVHCRAIIARSPFMLLGTADASGRCDVSPKGDQPGFVKVLDPHTLVIPDRPGNRRLDSFQNMLANPHVGLLFLIPGMDETLRVNGTAAIVDDPALLAELAVQGRAPQLGILVHVEECYLHCPKAFLRGRVWDPAAYMAREELPSMARMIQDQTRPAGRSQEEHERAVAEAEAGLVQSSSCLY